MIISAHRPETGDRRRTFGLTDHRSQITESPTKARMETTSDAAAVVVARVLLPDDANPAGNVHGGTTLRIMEEAGMIAATRHMSAAAAAAEV